VQLRAHHLLCALTFRGAGYGEDFIDRFNHSIACITAGADILLCTHADALCNSGQNCGQCDTAIGEERDKNALKELRPFLGVDNNLSMDAASLEQLREAFKAGKIRSACTGCAWFDLCTSVAQRNFRHTKLQINP